MLNNVKLGVKIGIQLAILILIMVALGTAAAIMMKTVSGESTILKNEHLPAVEISVNLERSIVLTMEDIISFWLSENDKYFDEAKIQLESAKKYIKEAQQLTSNASHLTDFKNAVTTIEQQVNAFEKLMTETGERTNIVRDSVKTLDEASAAFMKNADILMELQRDIMEAEIIAGIETEKIHNRLVKMNNINEVVVLLNEIRAAVFTSRIQRDPNYIREVQKNFDPIEKTLQNLLAITIESKIKKMINDTILASNTYRAAMAKVLENQIALNSLNEKRKEIDGKVREQAQQIMTSGMDLAKKISEGSVVSLSRANNIIIIGLVICIAAGIVLAMIITRGITRPIRKTVEIANAIAQGDMTKKLDIKSQNEIGNLAASLNQAATDLSSMLVQIKENSVTLAGSSEELSTISSQLASSSEETSSGVNSMATAVEQMSVGAQSVSSTAEQMTSLMNSIASAMEEMSASIKSISKNASEGADISQKAMQMSKDATATITTLGQAAAEIGDVTEMIKQIAQQTNLLALNATIEAASAGDAGRGFSVVANEIKALAGQSGKAAENISKKISGVQTSVRETVQAIGNVSEIIGKINEFSTITSNAVDQQKLTSNEISSNVQQANEGVKNIASSIAEIAKGTTDVSKNAAESAKSVNQISSGAHQIKTSSNDLAKIASRLQEMVSRFKV